MARVKSNRRRCTTRHRLSRDTTASGNAPGGKRNRLLMQTLNQSHLNQFGQTIGANQARVEGPELIKMQDPFAAFKKQLNLPANAVEFQHDSVAGECFRQGGQNTEVARQAQGRGIGGSAFFGGIAAQSLAAAASGFGGQGTNQKPHPHRRFSPKGDIYYRPRIPSVGVSRWANTFASSGAALRRRWRTEVSFSARAVWLDQAAVRLTERSSTASARIILKGSSPFLMWRHRSAAAHPLAKSLTVAG